MFSEDGIRLTKHARLAGHTVHIMEALEKGEISPTEFASLRFQIVGRPGALRLLKSLLAGPARRRAAAVPAEPELARVDDG